MKIYILYEQDYDGKELIKAYEDKDQAKAEAERLEIKKWADGYSGYGGRGYYVEEIELIKL